MKRISFLVLLLFSGIASAEKPLQYPLPPKAPKIADKPTITVEPSKAPTATKEVTTGQMSAVSYTTETQRYGLFGRKTRTVTVPTVSRQTDAVTGTTQTVPYGSHAHYASDGSVIIHGNENWGVPHAHDGMSTRRIAEGGQTVTGNIIPLVASGKPKRVNYGGKWYDQYADGHLVECVQCNQSR
jgi:hypothetical protein